MSQPVGESEATEPTSKQVTQKVTWVDKVKRELQGMCDEQSAYSSDGVRWNQCRDRIGHTLFNISYWYHRKRGTSHEDAEDMAVMATVRAQKTFESHLPASLDYLDEWFGSVLANCNRSAYAHVINNRPPPPPPSDGPEGPDGPDPGGNVHDEAERRDIAREPVRIAWFRLQVLNRSLTEIPTKHRLLMCLTDGATDFYRGRLDKVCPGLSGYTKWEDAESRISRIDPDAIIGLPEEPGELFDFLRPRWEGWNGKPDSDARRAYDRATHQLRNEFGITIAAFPAREDYQDEL